MGKTALVNDSRFKLFSADPPERLRGPQHHHVWCDELGAREKRGAFDQLWFGLRLGRDPRMIIMTTPRNTEMLCDLLIRQNDDVLLTRGARRKTPKIFRLTS
jgi:phage terminase large subunit-like protein